MAGSSFNVASLPHHSRMCGISKPKTAIHENASVHFTKYYIYILYISGLQL